MDLRFSDIREYFKDFFIYFLIIIAVFFIVVYVVSLQQVSGPSMEPNYYNQDILLLNKLHYKIMKPKRFDVVAVDDRSELIIKRVIGLPGETLAFFDNMLYINGLEVEEDFLKGSETVDFSLEDLGYTVIPENHYLVIGDNRSKSTDSRNKEVGLISKDKFIGKVIMRLWRVKG